MADVIKTAELHRLLLKEDCLIIDLRPSDSFNGWKHFGEHRSGHITGAVSLPEGTVSLDRISERNRKPIILYGADKSSIKDIARKLRSSTNNSVKYYLDFADIWTSQGNLPMNKLQRHKYLLPTCELRRIIDTGEDCYLFHCHNGENLSSEQVHIPGAYELNTRWLEEEGTWNRKPFTLLKSLTSSLGLNLESPIILYGEQTDQKGSGQIGAFRCAHILMYMGFNNVRILNGGLEKWIDEKRPLSETPFAEPGEIQSDLGDAPLNPQYFVDFSEALSAVQSGQRQIVSVRSLSEFEGITSGYSYIPYKGHIPGAILSDCGGHAHSMSEFRHNDQTMEDFTKIDRRWRDSGIKDDSEVIFSCGTGWRASEAWFYAWLQGKPSISVYDGGWLEWSTNHHKKLLLTNS